MPSPPPMRDAATIILVREKNHQPQIYLMKRNVKSSFMGGYYVFPGGVVEDQDREIESWKLSIDVTLSELESRFCDDRFDIDSAVCFGIAAIRETLEEAGVLIAVSDDKKTDDFTCMADLRLEKDLPDNWFNNKMVADNWMLGFSRLGCWSHWITPEQMKKRFDTRFFLVMMPENQTCVPDDTETKHGIWATPQKALEQNLTARIPLSPPTIVTLTQLADFPTLTAFETQIQGRSWGDPIEPIMMKTSEGPVIIEPWDSQFNEPDSIRLVNLNQKILDPLVPFSRIWCNQGIWKPVGV